MSPKSKKVHASKSKSKSRTVKKSGGLFWNYTSNIDESKLNSIAPPSFSPGNEKSTSTPTNKSNNVFGIFTMPDTFSSFFDSSKSQSSLTPQVKQVNPTPAGGKRRFKKSRTSKKQRKATNAK